MLLLLIFSLFPFHFIYVFIVRLFSLLLLAMVIRVDDADIGGVIVVVLSSEAVHGTKAVWLKCPDRKGMLVFRWMVLIMVHQDFDSL